MAWSPTPRAAANLLEEMSEAGFNSRTKALIEALGGWEVAIAAIEREATLSHDWSEDVAIRTLAELMGGDPRSGPYIKQKPGWVGPHVRTVKRVERTNGGIRRSRCRTARNTGSGRTG